MVATKDKTAKKVVKKVVTPAKGKPTSSRTPVKKGTPGKRSTPVKKESSDALTVIEPKKERKTYDLPGQKRDPPDENDSQRKFYCSLREQNPSSEMAEVWMMEYGLLSAEEAKKAYDSVVKRKNKAAAKASNKGSTRTPTKTLAKTPTKTKTPPAKGKGSAEKKPTSAKKSPASAKKKRPVEEEEEDDFKDVMPKKKSRK